MPTSLRYDQRLIREGRGLCMSPALTFLSLLLPLGLGSAAIVLLLAFYKPASDGLTGWLQQRFGKWEFSLDQLGGFRWSSLAIASLLGLFLEMLMIRWISAEVPVFAYFKNFILIACFLGLGVGCYFSKRRINILAFLGPLLLLTAILKLPWRPLQIAIQHLPTYLGATSETFVWDTIFVPLTGYAALLVGIALVLIVVALVTFIFVPIGQVVGWHLEQKGAGVRAYTVNVVASLAGIFLYTILCFLYQPPAVWFAVAGAMLLLLIWRIPQARWPSAATFLLCIILVNVGPAKPAVELWSPYQKVKLVPHPDATSPTSWELQTNDSWHQEMIDLSAPFVAGHPELFTKVPIEYNAYNIPYRFYPKPPSVLVLGAGTGNDVAAAVRNGAERVVAVEIDPLILRLGRKLHFEKPYDSPRVHVELNDARSYIQNSTDRFDVIVFSLLDSHTTASHFSNIRIDNYVYTVESLRAARKLLQPDGVFIVKFWVSTPWVAGRLYGLVAQTFGQPPLDLRAVDSRYTTAGRFFIAGSKAKIQVALDDPALRTYLHDDRIVRSSNVVLTTDDWPNFYQREPGIPLNVVVAASFLVLLWFAFLRQIGMRVASLRWHFFFLGAGFMLLEAQIVSRMALLFGTTWLVNVIVVGGILLLVVSANVVTESFATLPAMPVYAGLLLSLAVGYFIPLGKLFLPSVWMRVPAAILALCIPMFFAGLIFIRSFAAASFSSEALGSNLFGALVGGLLELLSLWTGIKSLLIVAALLYLASWIAMKRDIGGRLPPLGQSC